MSGPSDRRPVGVFDSGVGGLTVLRALQAQLPDEHFIYYADIAHCPYGGQPAAAIRARAESITEELLSADCKLIVVACNTATIASIAGLRARYPLPFVGMEPAVKPACAATRNGVIGVMATQAALGGDKFQQLVDAHASGIRVITQPCPGLVERIEGGDLDGPVVRDLVQRYLAPIQAAGADVVVLGCTHYPFLRPLVEQLAGPAVAVIDTGAAVARQAERLLEQHGLRAQGPQTGRIEWRGSGRIGSLDDWYARVP